MKEGRGRVVGRRIDGEDVAALDAELAQVEVAAAAPEEASLGVKGRAAAAARVPGYRRPEKRQGITGAASFAKTTRGFSFSDIAAAGVIDLRIDVGPVGPGTLVREHRPRPLHVAPRPRRTFKSIEEAAQRRSEGNIVGKLPPSAARVLCPRGLLPAAAEVDGAKAVAWSTDPALMLPSRFKQDEVSSPLPRDRRVTAIN